MIAGCLWVTESVYKGQLQKGVFLFLQILDGCDEVEIFGQDCTCGAQDTSCEFRFVVNVPRYPTVDALAVQQKKTRLFVAQVVPGIDAVDALERFVRNVPVYWFSESNAGHEFAPQFFRSVSQPLQALTHAQHPEPAPVVRD